MKNKKSQPEQPKRSLKQRFKDRLPYLNKNQAAMIMIAPVFLPIMAASAVVAGFNKVARKVKTSLGFKKHNKKQKPGNKPAV